MHFLAVVDRICDSLGVHLPSEVLAANPIGILELLGEILQRESSGFHIVTTQRCQKLRFSFDDLRSQNQMPQRKKLDLREKKLI